MSTHELNATAASVLGFLLQGPKTGWDLVSAIENSVGYFWNVTRSQVYRELKTLAMQGFVEEKNAGTRDKVPYAITTAGRAAFSAWIAEEPAQDILRLPLVLTVFFGKEVNPALLRRYLEKARLEHLARLDAYAKLRASFEEGKDDIDPFARSTLDLGTAYEKTMIAWIEGLPWFKAPRSAKKSIGRAAVERTPLFLYL